MMKKDAAPWDEEHTFAKSACGMMPQLSAYFLMKAVDFLAARRQQIWQAHEQISPLAS